MSSNAIAILYIGAGLVYTIGSFIWTVRFELRLRKLEEQSRGAKVIPFSRVRR